MEGFEELGTTEFCLLFESGHDDSSVMRICLRSAPPEVKEEPGRSNARSR